MKRISKNIFILGILLFFISGCSAGETSSLIYDFNGDGNATYPNEGYIYVSASASFVVGESGLYIERTSAAYNDLGHNVNYYIHTTQHSSVNVPAYDGWKCWFSSGSEYNTVSIAGATADVWWVDPGPIMHYNHDTPSSSIDKYIEFLDTSTSYTFTAKSGSGEMVGGVSGYGSASMSILITTNQTYSISGNMGCLDNVSLWKGSYFIGTNFSENIYDEYKFKNLLSNTDYSLVFSDGHVYNFSLSSDEVYNYDACTYTIINLKDYCGNKLYGMSTDIYASDAGDPASYEFLGTYTENPIQLQSGVDIEVGKMLDIYIDTDMGPHHDIVYADNQTYTLFHPYKYWRLTIIAKDDQTLNPIENVKILANQSCKIDPSYPLTSQLLTNDQGKGTFSQLSGENIYVSMWGAGYKVEKFFVGGIGSCFETDYELTVLMNTSGADDTEYTNETENVSAECSIFFTNENGKKTNRINDTDGEVHLNYTNGNCSATLKFQRLYGSYWMTKQSWNIPALENGSKIIPNSNFSDYDACYRAYMYSYSCDCNSTLSLYVLNQTVEEDEHYQNLSVNCWFKHQLGGGQVDYKSPVEIVAYANATDAFLLDINLTLNDSSGEIATYQCDWADFAGASLKWYYIWQPTVSYQIGENYTVVMTGYNGHYLDADEVWTSNIRNNALTVNVKDNYGNPLSYSTVFVEDWGSLATGSDTFGIVTGLSDGNFQYKATKSGYISSSWDTVTLSEEDKSVTCVLIELAETSVIGQKMSEEDIKSFFIPLMYILFIFMILGAFKYANE